MRKASGLLVLGFLMFSAQTGQAQKLGAGAFAGINFPIVQDDAGKGTVWGLRGLAQPTPLFRVEANLSFVKNGDYELSGIGGTYSFDGGKLTSYGLNVIVGSPMGVPGIGVGLVAGIGNYKYEVENYDSDTRVGYSGGLDLSLGFGPLPVRVSGRGELLVIPLEDGGSRKHALVSVGAIYAFGPQ